MDLALISIETVRKEAAIRTELETNTTSILCLIEITQLCEPRTSTFCL